MSGNGKPPQLTPEQIVAQIAQQRAMAAPHEALQRRATATALLSGILSGLYSNVAQLPENFGDRAINDAVVFADRLIAELAKPPEQPKAANDGAAAPPAGETATGGTDSPGEPAKIPS